MRTPYQYRRPIFQGLKPASCLLLRHDFAAHPSLRSLRAKLSGRALTLVLVLMAEASR